MGIMGRTRTEIPLALVTVALALAVTLAAPRWVSAAPKVAASSRAAISRPASPGTAPAPPPIPREEVPGVPMVFPYENRVAALMYHHLTVRPEAGSSMTVVRFREQMEYLRTGGFSVISMHTLAGFLRGEAILPPKAVLLTFDDGYESLYTHAYPILKEFNFPATCFVVVAHVGTTAPGGGAPHLSWEEMLELQRSGLVSFGSHTYDQHVYAASGGTGPSRPALVVHEYDPVTGLTETDAEYEERVYDDLLLSKRLLEQHLGVTTDAMAFPYGASTPTTRELSRRAGFQFMFSTQKGIIARHSGWAELRRINAGSEMVTVPTLADRIGEAIFDSMTTWFRANG